MAAFFRDQHFSDHDVTMPLTTILIGKKTNHCMYFISKILSKTSLEPK